MAFSGPHANTRRIPRTRGDAGACRRKFLAYFPDGFADETYVDWERGYKWRAHRQWQAELGRAVFSSLLEDGAHGEIAARAVRIEARTNLLFSFEKMALRDAVRTARGARRFAEGLFDFLHGREPNPARFEAWIDAVGALPRRQTRVLTWPVVTVFGFIAQPRVHLFLKPNVTRLAARRCGLDLHYASRPNGRTYESLLALGARLAHDLRDLRPRDMIDIQSFLWVQGSEEYPPKRGERRQDQRGGLDDRADGTRDEGRHREAAGDGGPRP